MGLQLKLFIHQCLKSIPSGNGHLFDLEQNPYKTANKKTYFRVDSN